MPARSTAAELKTHEPARPQKIDQKTMPAHGAGPRGKELLGIAFCFLAAVFYTAANITLRYLAGVEASPVTVIFFKELVAVIALLPLLVYQWSQGKRVFVNIRIIAVLAVVGLAVQLGANLGQQWALGVIGLAVVTPTIFAAMLGSSALLGFLLLGERISWQGIAAVVLVILAITCLNVSLHDKERTGLILSQDALQTKTGENQGLINQQLGSQPAVSLPRANTAPFWAPHSAGRVVLALLTCCGAGFIYSLLGISIRWARLQGATVESTVFLVTFMGVVGLGPFLLIDQAKYLARLDGMQFTLMLIAGIANLFAFALITKGYRLTRVLYANMTNASQVALGALAGITLFAERVNRWLIAGVVLTLAGVLLMGYSATRENNRHQGQ